MQLLCSKRYVATYSQKSNLSGNVLFDDYFKSQKRFSRYFSFTYDLNAVTGGYLHILQYLHANGCDWASDMSSCKLAAEAGHLEVLKWLRANGCPWNAQTCAHAARGGHLEVLKW